MRWMTGWMGTFAVMLGSMPAAAAPFAWITNQGSNTVSRLDLATHLSVTTAVGESPFSVAPVPDGSRTYVGNSGDKTISVVDGQTVTAIDSIPLFEIPQGIAVTPDGTKLYAARVDGIVDVIDTATATVSTSIDLSFGGGSAFLMGATINPAGTLLYVAKSGGVTASLAVIDTTTDQLVADVFLAHDGNFPLSVTVSPDGTRVYSTAMSVDRVRVVDATTNLLIDEIPMSCPLGCGFMQGIVTGADGTRLYVSMANYVGVVDTATAAEITAIPINGAFSWLDVTPDGARLYAVDTNGEIGIIDTATDTVIGTLLAVGQYPGGFGRFIAPGATTTTTTSSTSTSTSTTSTVPPVPVLSATARTCQTAIAGSWKKYPDKVHKLFTGCYDRVLRDVAGSTGTAAATASCLQQLDPGASTSALARARSAARAQILGRCGGIVPAQVATPCSTSAATMAEVADCVLDRQAEHVAAIIAAEYGASCSIAGATGLTTLFPTLCGP